MLTRWMLFAMLGVMLAGCPNKNCSVPPTGNQSPCIGGCACGGGCTCDFYGRMICSASDSCRVTCRDDGGVERFPGDKWMSSIDTCTCDYSGNIRCCPTDAGSCSVACVDARGEFHQLAE